MNTVVSVFVGLCLSLWVAGGVGGSSFCGRCYFLVMYLFCGCFCEGIITSVSTFEALVLGVPCTEAEYSLTKIY